ncbi:RIP metalloprotease [Nocardioides sp.]|uniref:M50 family metallopeptidase n=1 Tax=Nocardioides sp. TaxID=35761 RepID=UPI003515F727
MTALYYALGVVVFVLAILISIGLHEFGHLIPAKRFGGRVTQYFIGFGPTLWSRQRGETEYGIKAIPLGGYVKIVGMLPPAPAEVDAPVGPDGRPITRMRDTSTGLFTQLVSDARAAEWEIVRPEDEDRLFYRMAWWKKVIVMAGGPTVNLLIAFFLFWGLFAFYGQQSVEVAEGPPVVDEVSACVIPYDAAAPERACTDADPPSPAARAGLEPGDVITAFNGTPVTSWEQLRELIRGNADGSAVIDYERDGRPLSATTSTTVELRPDPDSDATLREVGFLGVTPVTRVVTEYGGPLYTLRELGGMTVDSIRSLVELPVKVVGVGKAILGLEERAVDSPVSIVGGSRFAGETASAQDFPVGDKIASLVALIAGFNLFIGVLNFVPLLPLDGGHIASALWEAVRRGIARLRRRPDPGHVDAARLLPIAYVVGVALLVMGVVLIVGDLVVPVSLQG